MWRQLGKIGRGLWGDRPSSDPLGDAEAAVNQVVDQLQQDLLELRRAVAEAIALQKRTERQRHQIQGQVDYWQHRAQDALNRGDEPAARSALEQQWPHRQRLTQVNTLLQERRGWVQRLRQTLGKVETQVVDARTQRDLFVVRSQSASATLKLRETLDAVAGEGTQILERFETQVQILEVQTELLQMGSGAIAGEDSPDEAAIIAAIAALETHPSNAPSSPPPNTDSAT